MDSSPEHNPKQAGHTKPTIEEIKGWDEDELLEWIQKKEEKLLKGDTLEKFKDASIDGVIFLKYAGNKTYFHEECNLPTGTSERLADLASEIAGGETAGMVQKGKEQDTSTDPKTKRKSHPHADIAPSPKRTRVGDSSLIINGEPSELATRANEQRKLVREIITDLNSSSDQHSNSVDPLPGAVAQLSNPQIVHTLPFPFVGSEVPVRFKLDNEAKVGSEAEVRWLYAGRTKFETLIEKLKRVRKSLQLTTVWLYGTRGYGKSHLLAALVCYLAAQDERVIYIPDCRALLKNPVEYIRAAMLFAWANDIPTQKEIMTLNTQEEIEDFFWWPEKIIFVFDQINALKTSKRSEEAKKRADIYNWVMSLTSRYKSVFSSSANYWEFHDQNQQQSSNLVIYTYGGLDRMEMDEWWKRHSDIKMTHDKKSNFEDITGRIPLLLDKCMVNGGIDLTADYLRISMAKPRVLRSEYYKYVQACIRRESVPSGYNEYSDLIDHRYFYHESDERGNYTCGLVRNAVADQLLDEGVDFARHGYLSSLARSVDNKSITGFMIEHAVFLSMRSNGLAIGQDIGTPMELRVLQDLLSFNDDFTEKPVLYRPKSFNFKAIDGIILLIKDTDKTRKKLMMFPLQITLAPATHADSRVEFFKSYGNWITDLSRFDVEVQFLWITPESRDNKEYPAGPDGQPPKHLERYIPFKVVSMRLWEEYEAATGKLPKKKAAKRKPPKETAAKRKPPKETAAKGEPSKETAAEGKPPKSRSDRLKNDA